MLPAGEASGGLSSCEVMHNLKGSGSVAARPVPRGSSELVALVPGRFLHLAWRCPWFPELRRCNADETAERAAGRWAVAIAHWLRELRLYRNCNSASARMGHSARPATVPPGLNYCVGVFRQRTAAFLRAAERQGLASTGGCRPGAAAVPCWFGQPANRDSDSRGPPVRFRGCGFGFPPAPRG